MIQRTILLALCWISLSTSARAADGIVASLGPCTGATIEALPSVGCGPTLLILDDGTFENAFAWQYGGVCPTYGGAIAQPFSGAQTICSLEFGFTQIGNQFSNFMDVYIWDDDNGSPGAVQCIQTDVSPGPIAFWPSVSFHSVDLDDCCTPLKWWAGYWGGWQGAIAGWYVAADADGGSGPARTFDCLLGTWEPVDPYFGPVEAFAIRALSTCTGVVAPEFADGEWIGDSAAEQGTPLFYGELRVKKLAVHKTSDVGKADGWIEWAAGHGSCYPGSPSYPGCLDLQQAGSYRNNSEKIKIGRSSKQCLDDCAANPTCSNCSGCFWSVLTGPKRMYVEDGLLSPNFTSPVTFHMRMHDANHKWRKAAKALSPKISDILKCANLDLQSCKDLLGSVDEVWEEMETFVDTWDGRETTLGDVDHTFNVSSSDECFNLLTAGYDPRGRSEYTWQVFQQQNGKRAGSCLTESSLVDPPDQVEDFVYGQASANEIRFWLEVADLSLIDPTGFTQREFLFPINVDNAPTGDPSYPLCGADYYVSIGLTSDGTTITRSDQLYCWTCCNGGEPGWVLAPEVPYNVLVGHVRVAATIARDAISSPVGTISAWAIERTNGIQTSSIPQDPCSEILQVQMTADTNCPHLVSVEPVFSPSGNSVSRIVATFTEPMAMPAVAEVTFSPDPQVAFLLSQDASQTVLTITPAGGFFPPGERTLTLAGTIVDLSGNALQGDLDAGCGTPNTTEFCVPDSSFYVTNSVGTKVIEYSNLSDQIYVKGSGFIPGSTVYLYLVPSDDLEVGQLLVDLSETGPSLVVAAGGSFGPYAMGRAVLPGNYSIVADDGDSYFFPPGTTGEIGDRVVYGCEGGFTLGQPCNDLILDDITCWMPFEEPANVDRAADLINGRHGFFEGDLTTVFARMGYGLSFPGDAYIHVNDGWKIGTNDFSFSCWVRTSYGSLQSIYDNRQTSPDRGTHFALDSGGRLIVNMNDEGGWSNFTATGSVNDDQWHLVTATVDRDSELMIYIDGALDAIYDPSVRDGDLTANGPTFIGGHKLSSSLHFRGVLDDLRLYEGVLDPTTIEHLYEAGLEGVLCPENASDLGVDSDEVTEFVYQTEPNFPNPFQPETTIRFALDSVGPVDLVVLDVSGRRVRTLLSTTMEPGEHNVVWDGTDDSGRRLSGGIYFWRLSSDGRTLSRKMIMIE